MITWDNYFSGDLRYKYVNMLLKDLSIIESAYLKFLRASVDSQIHTTMDWYDEYQEELAELHNEEEVEDYYAESYLEMILITLMNSVLDRNRVFINRFYDNGGSLAYNHMGKDKIFLQSDEIALNNLTKYTDSVVESIHSEITYGIKEIIKDNVANESLDQFKKDLIQLPYKPITTPFSVDNRCAFATKTEYARSINTGLLQGYSNYGVDQYEWVTSGLPNVCKTCRAYEENNPYTLNQIIGMMPVHVNCVCSVKANLPRELYLQNEPQIVDITPKKSK